MVGYGSVLKVIEETPFQRGFSTNPFGTLARGASSVCHSGSKSKQTQSPGALLLFPPKAGVIYSPPMSGTLLHFSYFIKVLQNTSCHTFHLPLPASLAPALGLWCGVLLLSHSTMEAMGSLACE